MARKATHGPYGHRLYEDGSARITTSVELSGPFFEYDPAKRLGENIETMMAAIAREGEEDVQSRVASAGYAGGPFYRGIRGRVRSMTGRRWYRTAVVSQTYVYPWGVHGSRGFSGRGEAEYRGGKLEARHKFFRKTTTRLRKARAVNYAELARGLN